MGLFYLSLEVLNEKYLTLSYILTAHLYFFTFRSDHIYMYVFKFQKNLQFVIGCDGILKYPEISGQFLTRRPQMVTRWCTSPTDWIFLVKLQGDSLISMLRTFQHPVCSSACLSFPFNPEVFSIRVSSWLSFYRSSFFQNLIVFCVRNTELSFYYRCGFAFFPALLKDT